MRLAEAVYLAKCYGFEERRVTGGHHMMRQPDTKHFLNFQETRSRVPDYQIKQLLEAIEAINAESGE
jgi:predicted RNA binding protein YcfA (HicA-like mRNA interferase family)